MVSVRTGITVGVVDVTVATGVRVHTDAWVKGQGEDAVFAHQPVCINDGDQNDRGPVHLNEEGPDVGLFDFGLNDERCRDFNQHFAGFDVADVERFLRGEEFLTEHRFAGVEGVTCWHAEAFAQTKPLGSVWENGSLTENEVLLDFVNFNGVVKVVALSKRVADDVATDFDALRGGRCDERLGGRTGLVKRDEHGVQTGDHRVHELVDLDGDTVGDLGCEGGEERVFSHAPTFGVGLDVQVNVFPRAILRAVVKRLAAHHLRDGAVLVEEGFRGSVSHPLKFKRWVVFVVCFSDLLGEREVIICSIRTCFHKFNGRAVVIVDVAAHWHEHHQCAQQQRNPDTAEDGLLLVFLVFQHVSFTPYGLYAEHPTTYAIYMTSGAYCLNLRSKPVETA